MSEELIVSHCSPTMAGLKTGNLFACPVKDREELKASLRRMNLRLVPRGVRMIPVRYSDNKALIYMYRPDKLRRDLTDPIASSILTQRSYPTGSSERCVAELARRLNAAEEFPHEIGLFWAIRRRMWTASFAAAHGKQSASAHGEFTATRRPPGRNSASIKSASGSISTRSKAINPLTD